MDVGWPVRRLTIWLHKIIRISVFIAVFICPLRPARTRGEQKLAERKERWSAPRYSNSNNNNECNNDDYLYLSKYAGEATRMMLKRRPSFLYLSGARGSTTSLMFVGRRTAGSSTNRTTRWSDRWDAKTDFVVSRVVIRCCYLLLQFFLLIKLKEITDEQWSTNGKHGHRATQVRLLGRTDNNSPKSVSTARWLCLSDDTTVKKTDARCWMGYGARQWESRNTGMDTSTADTIG